MSKFYSLSLSSVIFLSLSLNCFAQTAEDYLNQGKLDAKQGNKNQAISDYTKAIEIDPNNIEAYFNRAAVQNTYNKAISDYTKVIELNPNKTLTALAYTYRGIIYNSYFYADQSYLTKAISDYTQAIKIDPNNVMAQEYLDKLKKTFGQDK